MAETFLDTVTIPKKHQVTIPKRVMTALEAKEGDTLEFVKANGTVILRKQPS